MKLAEKPKEKSVVQKLKELVDYAHTRDEGEEPRWQNSMEDMLDRHERGRLSAFTKKQLQYITETHDKIFDEPDYQNLVSEGKVIVGEHLRTPVPDVLLKPLPLKPPGRR